MNQIVERRLILVSGIPATGKSRSCRFLAREFGFAHYDMECHPRGWPMPELKPLWDSSRSAFIAALRARHVNVLLDWGFPPHCIQWIEELRGLGAQLVWFAGDVQHARRLFIERGGQDVGFFDEQVRRIMEAGFPDTLKCPVLNGLTPDGQVRDPREIATEILGI